MLQYGPRISTLEYVQQQWRIFCQKPPKGFEKFYRKKSAATEGKKLGETLKKGENNAADKGAQSAQQPRPPPASKAPPPLSGDKKSQAPQWSFKLFGEKSQSGPGGKIPQDSSKDTIVLCCGIGAFLLFGYLAYTQMGYKEITWRDFLNKLELLIFNLL